MLNFFKKNNPNYLLDYEKKSAFMLKNILEKNRNNKDVKDDLNELSIIVYYLSFKRSRKVIVEIENIDKTQNAHEYYDILGMTKRVFRNMADEANKPHTIIHPIFIDTCEKLILQVLQKNVEKLNLL